MKGNLILLLVFLSFEKLFPQNPPSLDQLDFHLLKTVYNGDTIDILIKSKKGEELKQKPLFLFCQGSLPKPLIVYDEQGTFGIFPFKTDSICNNYHLVIIGKPGIPLLANRINLQDDFSYTDRTSGQFPILYQQRNFPDYYVKRDLFVINFLQKKSWVSSKQLIVAGHSEGATIAARLAAASKKVTHFIYASENPLGRMLTGVEESRLSETDSLRFAENQFDYWEKIVMKKDSNNNFGNSDSYKNVYELSYPPAIEFLKNLSIPVLICYGTKDVKSSPFIDYFRLEMIRRQKKNFTFKAYIGLEHNFFPVKANGEVDYDKYNWDDVANDWFKWLEKN